MAEMFKLSELGRYGGMASYSNCQEWYIYICQQLIEKCQELKEMEVDLKRLGNGQGFVAEGTLISKLPLPALCNNLKSQSYCT